jgi:integrase/recombinase XerC
MYHDRAASLDAWLDLLPAIDRSGASDASDQLTVPQGPTEVTSRHIRTYIDAVAARTSQATASNHYRALQQFFKFLLLEGEIGADPFTELAPPKVASKPSAAIPDDALSRLLTVCKGTGLNALRDTAIITVLIDTGMRPSKCQV